MRPRSLAVGILALTLVLPFSTAAVADEIGTSSFTGTVVDSDGEPLANVLVRAGSPRAVAETTTATDGSFTIANLPASTYAVNFQEQDTSARGSQSWHEDGPTRNRYTPLDLGVGQTIDLDWTMPLVSTVTVALDCPVCEPSDIASAYLESRESGATRWNYVSGGYGVSATPITFRNVFEGEYRVVIHGSEAGILDRSAPFAVEEGVNPDPQPLVVRDKRLLVRTSTGTLHYMDGSGPGIFGTRKQLATGFGDRSFISDVGDFDSTGTDDVVARAANGDLEFFAGLAEGGLASPVTLAADFGVYSRIFSASGDVTGDGNNDIYAVTSAGTLWVHPGDGRGGLLPREQVGETGAWKGFTRLTAFGNNGESLIARTSRGNIYIFRSGVRQLVLTGWTSAASFAGTPDIDGDNSADVVIRKSTGELYRLFPDLTRKPVLIARGWNKYTSVS